MKKVAILGSTGSIGKQTLKVIENNSDSLVVSSLVAFSNVQLLSQQCEKFSAKGYLISDLGNECLIDAVKDSDIAVVATLGITALDAVMYCIDNNIDIAIANKEVLVTAGALIKERLVGSKSRLLPVDSEHSAIWQCLQSADKSIDKLYLTASGGALYNYGSDELKNATADMALKHPNWEMGSKITIDCATMMNKSLEVVEAHYLFDVAPQDIVIAVHRQSIVHSMVKFTDNSIIAQLSQPDMTLPIQYALLYPNRGRNYPKELDIFSMPTLTFDVCPTAKFPCSTLGHFMLNSHPLIATVVNACNDVCVEYYMKNKLLFSQIYDTIMYIVEEYQPAVSELELSIENIKYVDMCVRRSAEQYILEKE